MRKKESPTQYTPLHYAARYGKVKFARLLLKYGAPINLKGKGSFPPFTLACAYSRSNATLLLIQFGADPNVLQTEGCARNFTAFFWAVNQNLYKVVKAMWDKGNVNPNAGGILFIMLFGQNL